MQSLPILVFAFFMGATLTLMTLFNGQMAAAESAFFSSWVAHGTGTLAALVALWLIARRQGPAPWRGGAPLWAFSGGIAGAFIVIFSTLAVNSPLALSGTVALGLAGQVSFGLVADRFGLFGLPRRALTLRDGAATLLILAGSAILVFLGTS